MTYGKLKKEKLILGKNDSFIDDYGKFKFYFTIFLLIFHPVFFSIDRQFFVSESYYKSDNTFDDYKRPIVEYCILI